MLLGSRSHIHSHYHVYPVFYSVFSCFRHGVSVVSGVIFWILSSIILVSVFTFSDYFSKNMLYFIFCFAPGLSFAFSFALSFLSVFSCVFSCVKLGASAVSGVIFWRISSIIAVCVLKFSHYFLKKCYNSRIHSLIYIIYYCDLLLDSRSHFRSHSHVYPCFAVFSAV